MEFILLGPTRAQCIELIPAYEAKVPGVYGWKRFGRECAVLLTGSAAGETGRPWFPRLFPKGFSGGPMEMPRRALLLAVPLSIAFAARSAAQPVRAGADFQ